MNLVKKAMYHPMIQFHNLYKNAFIQIIFFFIFTFFFAFKFTIFSYIISNMNPFNNLHPKLTASDKISQKNFYDC